MEGIKIEVTGNIAKVIEKPNKITSGTVGLPVEFTFDSQWEGLRKIAVFQAGCTRKYTAVANNTTAVPMEVLEKPNVRLNIGVYGEKKDGSVALPTIWANLGQIYAGAVPEGSVSGDVVIAKRYYDGAMLAAEDAVAAAQKAESEAGVAKTHSYRAASAAERAAIAEEAVYQVAKIVCTATGSEISLLDAANAPLRGLSVYGKTTRSGTALNAAGAGGSITATVSRNGNISSSFGRTAPVGRVQNPLNSQWADPVSIGGVKIGGSDDNSYIFAFRAAQNSAGTDITSTHFRLRSITLTDTETLETIAYDFAGYANADGTAKELPIGTKAADGSWVHIDEYGANVKAENDYIRWKNGAVDAWCAFQLNGVPAGRYKIAFTMVPNAKGAAADVYIMPAGEQAIRIPTPDGLHGIEVTTGGYYTDESGKQWHCDEVDLARGVYVKRCGYIASYNGEDVLGAYISSSGSLSKGAKVVYALPKPVETPLDQETLTAYAALHTYKPYTVVSNNAGAGMLVEYVADTKTYIDNRITELRNAVIATGANI